jgi:hypothetical protein
VEAKGAEIGEGLSCIGGTCEIEGITGTSGTEDGLGEDDTTEAEGLS